MQDKMADYFREMIQTQKVLESTLKIRQEEQKRKTDLQNQIIQDLKREIVKI